MQMVCHFYSIRMQIMQGQKCLITEWNILVETIQAKRLFANNEKDV